MGLVGQDGGWISLRVLEEGGSWGGWKVGLIGQDRGWIYLQVLEEGGREEGGLIGQDRGWISLRVLEEGGSWGGWKVGLVGEDGGWTYLRVLEEGGVGWRVRRVGVYLRVLDEGGVVAAASGPLRLGPGPVGRPLVPRLAEGEDGRVDQRARVQPLEVMAEVLERHPAQRHVTSSRGYDDIRGSFFLSRHRNRWIIVTIPPEMSHIATRSLFGHSLFPKGGVLYLFWVSTNSVSPVFSTSQRYTCYTNRKFIIVISKCLKRATPPKNEGNMMKTLFGDFSK